ncbi:hypothetical protein RHOSPDRAFT_26270 [Rhodotorula sp. JG-1b]|nr:hypothetical protein RHOSPDRAFT_26270 [Rhodotorula sp. JG-1b]
MTQGRKSLDRSTFPFYLACELSEFSAPLDYFAVSLPRHCADLAVQDVFLDKRQLDRSAVFGSRMVLTLTPEAYSSSLITTPTHGKLPLHTIQIDKIRERLTKSQAERAEEKERDSNALATTEDYLQAFGFVKALLSKQQAVLEPSCQAILLDPMVPGLSLLCGLAVRAKGLRGQYAAATPWISGYDLLCTAHRVWQAAEAVPIANDSHRPRLWLDGISALLVHTLAVAAHREENLDAWPHMKQLLEDKWPTSLMTLKVRCSPKLEEPAHIKDFALRLLDRHGDAVINQLPAAQSAQSGQYHSDHSSACQLLQAEKEDRAYAYITLERIGKTIRHAASKGSPGSWFDLKSWMYAVFLSAQPPPDDIQASCLYDVVKLQQLNHMLSVAPQSEGTTIPFFRKLLEDTLELCEGGYDPRQGIGAKKRRRVFRQTDEILLQWAVPEPLWVVMCKQQKREFSLRSKRKSAGRTTLELDAREGVLLSSGS